MCFVILCFIMCKFILPLIIDKSGLMFFYLLCSPFYLTDFMSSLYTNAVNLLSFTYSMIYLLSRNTCFVL